MSVLGSYLNDMALVMGKLTLYMQRCAHLLRGERQLLTQPEQRRKTKEIAASVGHALEEVTKATGSVAHLFKGLEIGESVGQFNLDLTSYDPVF